MSQGHEDLRAIMPRLLSQLTELDTAIIVTHLPRLYQRLEHLSASFNEAVLHLSLIHI